MAKVVFATGTTTNSMTGEILEVTNATVERTGAPHNDGIEIINRAGEKIFLGIDAARQLAFILSKTDILK